MVINGIDTKDISVVVQGSIDGLITPLCLESIRKHLPGAEIVLSTWEKTDVDGLDYDQLLLNEDPGSFDCFNREYSAQNEINRILLSTSQGLKQVGRPYAIKIKTTALLESPGFLRWFDRYPEISKSYTFFRHRVICCSRNSMNPRLASRGSQFVCHPDETFFFGHTEDLVDLFDIPFASEEDQIFFAQKYRDRFTEVLHRFTAEQFLWVGFLKKHLSQAELLPRDMEDVTAASIALTEETFVANLILLDNHQIGIKCIPDEGCHPELSLSHSDWYGLYLRCCGRTVYDLSYPISNFEKNFRFKARDSGSAVKNKISGFLYNQIVPRLTIEEKERLKQVYIKLKPLYKKQGLHFTKSNYVESCFKEPVTDKNLSVILQGAVSNATRECIESVREFLPNAEIILSSWQGTDVDGLDYDQLVLSPDPGPSGLIRRFPFEHVNNVNRQIVSTRAGIQAATRRYCLKLRSDMRITSTAFLTYYNSYSQYIAPDAPVLRRIMVEGFLTGKDAPFAVSDWWYLGLKSDLAKYFNTPLYTTETVPYFEKTGNAAKRPAFADCVAQYHPESHITYCFVRMHSPDPEARALEFKYWSDQTAASVEVYHKFLAGSLLCLEFAKSGIILPKATNLDNPVSYFYDMPFSRWIALCGKYRTLPDSVLRVASEKGTSEQISKYLSCPHYYDVKNYACVVRNYAKLTHQTAFDLSIIKKEDITFVVSGRIVLDGEFNTRRCLQSVRRFFPESRIILSTWAGEPTEALENLYDRLILLSEPDEVSAKYLIRPYASKRNTVNFQQMAVHAGMEAVSTGYTVRLRSDFYLTSDQFLPFYEQWRRILRKTDTRFRVFQERVLVYWRLTSDARLSDGYYAYSLSDCFQFGRTEDLKALWDGHQEPFESLNYFEQNPDSDWDNPEHFNHRYNVEQYFFLNLLKKQRIDITYPEYYFDHSTERLVFESEKVYSANILVGTNQQLGIASKFHDGIQHPVSLTLERLIEIYLYNMEPDNEEGLAYLKTCFTAQSSEKASQICRHVRRVRKGVSLGLRCIKIGGKIVLYRVYPGYKAGIGVREQLMSFERGAASHDRSIMSRIEELIHTCEEEEERIAELQKADRDHTREAGLGEMR